MGPKTGALLEARNDIPMDQTLGEPRTSKLALIQEEEVASACTIEDVLRGGADGPAVAEAGPAIVRPGRRNLAPVLEFNETADDPYVMRQKVYYNNFT